MMALASDNALCALEFSSKNRMTRLNARLGRWFEPYEIEERSNPVIARAGKWLERYFAGTSADVNGLPLDLRGAAFERRVWDSRAVGLANGANPVAIIVPCHRVIGSNGSLTGYGGGVDKKRWLLDHERQWTTDRLF